MGTHEPQQQATITKKMEIPGDFVAFVFAFAIQQKENPKF